MTEFNHILNALPWPTLLVGPEGSLLRMINEVEAMLGDVLNAYVAHDTDLA